MGAGRWWRSAATAVAAAVAVALSAAMAVAPPATADDPAWTIIAGTFLDDSGVPTSFVRNDLGALQPSAWVDASEVSCTTGERDPLGRFASTDVASDGRFVLRVVAGGCYDVTGSWRSVGQDPLPLRRVPAGTTALELRARAWSWSDVLDSPVAYQGSLGLQVQSDPLSGDTLPVIGGSLRVTVGGWSTTATVDRTGRAWIRLPASVRPGAHTVTMAYSGTAITLPSTTTQTIGVRRVGATVRTTASGVAYLGHATVHVSVAAKLPASGRVVLYAGYYEVGSATLRKSHGHWVATIHTRRILSPGTLALRYGGNHDVAPVLHKVGTVKRPR